MIVIALARAATAAPPPCKDVGEAPVKVATAATAGEYGLTIELASASATKWNEANNEALVLEVSGAKSRLIGHLIVHQGKTKLAYTMHVGALEAGEALSIAVSKLSAAKATKKVSACTATLAPADEGALNAPIFRWPVQKSFNDVPLLVGWSKTHKAYQTVMTNEDGGTAEICGGGAEGMQAEIARWGRSTDIEAHYHYGDHPSWERCTKGGGEVSQLHMEAAHPILYWGNGHNRLFEDRSGYGHACGDGRPEKPDGDLAGWNVNNPSSRIADDPGKVIILRPLPVDLDAIGYAQFGGRREAIADRYGPWMYRLSSLELQREGKIDDAKTFAMSRYLYVDVRVADVGGEGGTYCSKIRQGGFVLRAVTKKGKQINSPQITKAYASGGAHDWKRVAIALPDGVTAADIDHFIFDAYDGDGIYVTGLGDAFVPVADGDDGAKLDYVRKGTEDFAYYVDDDSSDCAGGTNSGGPGNTAYRCTGGQVELR